MLTRRPLSCPPRSARGISMLIALIALALLTIAAVAMVRGFSGSSTLAGNLAFRRDLTNEGERAIVAVRQAFLSGTLAAAGVRDSNLAGANYFASRLESNSQGIPKVLLSDSLFSRSGLRDSNDIADSATGVTVRYVIDRQCSSAGPYSADTCTLFSRTKSPDGHSKDDKPDAESRPAYRVTVRVTGPRNIQAFLQTTLAY